MVLRRSFESASIGTRWSHETVHGIKLLWKSLSKCTERQNIPGGGTASSAWCGLYHQRRRNSKYCSPRHAPTVSLANPMRSLVTSEAIKLKSVLLTKLARERKRHLSSVCFRFPYLENEWVCPKTFSPRREKKENKLNFVAEQFRKCIEILVFVLLMNFLTYIWFL